jgi:hypothetical protein
MNEGCLHDRQDDHDQEAVQQVIKQVLEQDEGSQHVYHRPWRHKSVMCWGGGATPLGSLGGGL